MPGLFFDENLSEAVLSAVIDLFPGSIHLRSLGLAGAGDREVWQTAGRLGLVLVTRVYDFETLSVLLGHPPKVVHLEAFNPSNADVIATLRRHAEDIHRFVHDPDASFLSLRLRQGR